VISSLNRAFSPDAKIRVLLVRASRRLLGCELPGSGQHRVGRNGSGALSSAVNLKFLSFVAASSSRRAISRALNHGRISWKCTRRKRQWPKLKDDRKPQDARARIGAAAWTGAPMRSSEGSERGAPSRTDDPAWKDARIPQQPALRCATMDARTDAQRPRFRLFFCSALMAARIKTAAPPTDSAIIVVMSDIELYRATLRSSR
jgi:hypothetical protein